MAKNYVGSGWSKTFANGGMNVSLSVNVEKLLLLPRNKYGDVRIVAGSKKDAEEGKPDWFVAEDEYWTKKLTENEGQF